MFGRKSNNTDITDGSAPATTPQPPPLSSQTIKPPTVVQSDREFGQNSKNHAKNQPTSNKLSAGEVRGLTAYSNVMIAGGAISLAVGLIALDFPLISFPSFGLGATCFGVSLAVQEYVKRRR